MENSNDNTHRKDTNLSNFKQVDPTAFQSSEKTRQVVVRPDGSKVVRVERKRRVLGNDRQSEKSREVSQMKTTVIVIAAILVLGLGGIAGLIMYKISDFNSESYQQKLKNELSAKFNAESVECTDLRVDITTASMKSLILRQFPAESPVEFVRVEGIDAEIKPSSFFVGYIKGTKFTAQRLFIGLKPNAKNFSFPEAKELLKTCFEFYLIPDFYIGTASPGSLEIDYKNSPFYMNTELYFRRSYNTKEESYYVSLARKKLVIKGWPDMKIDNGSLILSDLGFNNMKIYCSLDHFSVDKQSSKTVFQLSGDIPYNAQLDSKLFNLRGTSVRLSYFIGTELDNLVKNDVGRSPLDDKDDSSECDLRFSLPTVTQVRPPLEGMAGSVIDSQWSSLPVFQALSELTGRKSGMKNTYSSPKFTSGNFKIETDGTNRFIRLDHMNISEPNVLALSGFVEVKQGILSGDLTFYIPTYRVDRKDCPSSVVEDGPNYRINVQLSGTPTDPKDTSAPILEQIMELRRKSMMRPPSAFPSKTLSDPANTEDSSKEAKPSFDSFIQ